MNREDAGLVFVSVGSLGGEPMFGENFLSEKAVELSEIQKNL